MTGSAPLESAEEVDVCEYVLIAESLNDGVLSAKQLAVSTAEDEGFAKVQKWLQEGWPSRLAPGDTRLKPNFDRREEMTVSHGLLYWGHRVVPEVARTAVLRLLHDTHQRVCSLKMLPRSMLWYPRIDQDIERLVKTCHICVQAAPMPPRQTPVPWPETGRRWSRLHIDFAGPVDGFMLFVVVDSHTKWIETVPMKIANG